MITEEYNIVSGETSLIEWVAATLPKEGEQECADLYLVKPTKDGAMLVVVDGLGHGPEAVYASKKVVNCLESNGDKSLIEIVKDCHENLKGTRGAVLSIARLNGVNRELSWLSVGNVEGILMCRNEQSSHEFKQLILRSGVVGYKLPKLNISVEKVSPGDILFFTTDGVLSEYVESLNYNRPMRETVKYTAKNYFKDSDDSLILAVRFKSSSL